MANKSPEYSAEYIKSKLFSSELFDNYMNSFRKNLTSLQIHEKNNLRRSRHRE